MIPGAWILVAAAALAAGLAAAPLPGQPGIGAADPRVRVDPSVMPWRAVGRLQTELGTRCTGTLIGPRAVLTAAHCLFIRGPNHYAQPHSVHFLDGYAHGTYAAHAAASSFVIPPGFNPMVPGATEAQGWAVVTLAAPLGTPDRILPLAARLPEPGTPVMLGGYEADHPEVLRADRDCHVLGLMRDAGGGILIRHDCAATHGTSGAPLLARRPDGGWEILGIASMARQGEAGGLAVPVLRPRGGRA